MAEVRGRNLLEDTYIFVVARNVTYIIYIYIELYITYIFIVDNVDVLLTSLLLRGIFLIWRIRRAKHSFFGLYLENHAIY